MSDEIASLVAQIEAKRSENASLRAKLDSLKEHKAQLELRSKNLAAIVADKPPEQGLDELRKERAFVAKKAIHDEETVKAAQGEKLGQILHEKEKVQKQVSAEAIFVSQNLRRRLTTTRKETQELRREFVENSKKLAAQLMEKGGDDVTKRDITAVQTELVRLNSELGEGYKEIDGLQLKMERLNVILERLIQKKGTATNETKPVVFDAKRRRSNFAAPRVHVVPR